ncbi:MAG: nucleotidyl transferase AbiEii/AbiGii toxin family protein [Panacagrimonas sp.]
MSKSALAGLPEATLGVFTSIRSAPGISSFTLIGGTALALRLCHRLSEDLDFVTVGSLDQSRIIQVLEHLHRAGHKKFTKIENPATKLEFESHGAHLGDYSQGWRVDGVKLQFFAKRLPTVEAQHAYEARMGAAPVPGVDTGLIQVATEAFIFATKAQVLAERLVSRDLFDVRTLIETGRYTFADLLAHAEAMGASPDLVRERLVNGPMNKNDPPVNRVHGAAVDVASLRHWFVELVNEHERAVAMQYAAVTPTPKA